MCLVKDTFKEGTDPALSLSWLFFGYETKRRGWSGIYDISEDPKTVESAQRWNKMVLQKVDTTEWPDHWKLKCQRDRLLVVGVMGSWCCLSLPLNPKPHPTPTPITYIQRLPRSSRHEAHEASRVGSVLAWTLELGLDVGPRSITRGELGLDAETV